MYGTADDCRRCACPLEQSENNFSPSCQLKELSLDIHHTLDNDFNIVGNAVVALNESLSDYICTQCPDGYVGEQCEQ